MNAPDETPRHTFGCDGDIYEENDGDWVRYTDHQSAIADRDREIARLQAELAATQEAVTIRQHALEQRTAANEALEHHLKLERASAVGLYGAVTRLQSRLDAGPSVERLRDWALWLDGEFNDDLVDELCVVANRMEKAANGK